MRELLVILPTTNTFVRLEKEGLIQALKEEAKRGVKIRMLIELTEASINGYNNDNNYNNFKSNEERILQELLKDSLIEVQHLKPIFFL
jgi:hypothetical protein